MKLQPKNRWYLVVAAVLFFISLVAGAYAEPVTRLSGVQPLHSLKKFYSIPNFKIGGEYEFGNETAYEFGGKGGVTLESLGQEPLRTARSPSFPISRRGS